MKLVTWNVNGLRSCVEKGFLDVLAQSQADLFCIQETKMQPEQVSFETPGYHLYMHSAVRKGYSGTAVFAKKEPVSLDKDFGKEGYDDEGRIMTLDMGSFYLVNAYVPNAKEGLLRLDYRMKWEDAMREHLVTLDKKKPVIYCGDLNVAHEEIDIKNPSSNHKSAGFSDEEREKMTKLLAAGFVDSYRYLYPDKVEYSWWSYRFNARKNNAGWRIDSFIVSERIAKKIQACTIHTDVLGSDHCPVSLEIVL